MNAPILRLTALAHGGGCGCKLSPAVLRELLGEQPAAAPFANLLVGTETGDDAAVWRLDDETCIVATTDFFMPMVDDPFDFGRIAATNALSDVYAMGGKPIFALAILGMPINSMPTAMIREILRGGAAMAAEAGIPVAGGHSIDSPEPIYGLAVVGLVSTKALRRNSEARPGDALILTKPLGVGIYSAAIKKDALSDEGYREMLGFMTRLNVVGAELARMNEVHAMTDVTGFGLLGHALEMARGAGVTVRLRLDEVPLLTEAESSRPRRLRHGRLAPQLGELWRGRLSAGGIGRLAAPAVDRPADFGRSARRLRRSSGARDPCAHPRRRSARHDRRLGRGWPSDRSRRRLSAARVIWRGAKLAEESGRSNPPETGSLPHTDLKSERPTGDDSPPLSSPD